MYSFYLHLHNHYIFLRWSSSSFFPGLAARVSLVVRDVAAAAPRGDAHGGGPGRRRVFVGHRPIVAAVRARETRTGVERVTNLALPVLVRGDEPRSLAVCSRKTKGKVSVTRHLTSSARVNEKISGRWFQTQPRNPRPLRSRRGWRGIK